MDESSSSAPAQVSEAPPPLHALADDGRRWALFLDFDGTLVDLAASPEKIEVPPALPRLLQGLATAFRGALAIFTGRTLANLDRHLGIRLPAAGQHGVQRRVEVGEPAWEAPMLLPDGARDRLRELTALWSQLLVEDKGTTLAVHYRAIPEAGGRVQALLNEIVKASGGKLQIQAGKYVYELRPAGIDKGTALGAFLNTPPFAGRLPLVVGDDLTDEAAFAVAMRAGGAAVKVGYGTSCAQWRLDTPQNVREWLYGMLETR